MRHWTVSLMREGRTSRQWHVWAETLTVGSHGAARVRLPLPVEPWALRLTELAQPQEFDIGEFHLLIADTTSERSTLWERAQIRIQASDREISKTSSKELHPTPFGTILVALCLAGITHWTAENFASDAKPDPSAPSRQTLDLPPSVQALPSPRSPFDTSAVTAPAPAGLRLVRGVASAPAPSMVQSAIVAHTDSAHWSGSSSGSHAPALATSHSSTPDDRLVAAWPESSSASWKSLDQPPPEPPH